jgi:hypothetical protein
MVLALAPAEVLRQAFCALVLLLRVLREEPHDNGRQPRMHGVRGQRRGRPGEVGVHPLERPLAIERTTPCEHHVEHDPSE